MMTTAEIEEIIVTRTGVSPDAIQGAAATSLAELGVDSLGVLEMQALIVDRYGVEIPDEALEWNVQQIADFVNGAVRTVA
jgi:acyl carrier protein